MQIIYEKLATPTPQDVEELNHLLQQLSKTARSVDHEKLTNILKETTIFVARDTENKNKMVGTATLTHITKLTADFGTLEDVVIDENYRKQGIATQLIEEVTKEAKKHNMWYVELTSRPTRVEANKLYQKLGFEERETNIYRINLK